MKQLITISAILTFTFGLHAYELDQSIKETGLKTIVIETIDNEEPTCETIKAPAGSWGEGITNVNKVPGSLKIYDPDGNVVFESGEYLKKESGMTIKVRGNTSAREAKKPFKIKLEKKGDLLCRDDKDLRDKNWVLLTNRGDLLEVGFITGKLIGMPWAPEFEYVNVVINGEFRGLYTLAESVERNEKCRIVTDESGFIIERDPYWWNENGEYLPSKWNPQFNWTLKYPDFEDLEEAQTAYIQEMIKDFEEILATENYENLIDVDSFCRWLIAQDILGTSDGGGTNFYLAKKDDSDESKLFVPVLWDVDSGEETDNAWSNVHSQAMITPLLNNPNKTFLKRFVELYWELSPTVYNFFNQYIEDLKSDKYDDYNKAVKLNKEVWGEESKEYSFSQVTEHERWFPARKLWLDNEFEKIATSLGVNGITDIEETSKADVFNIQGVHLYEGPLERFTPSQKGIYIILQGSLRKKVKY